MVEYTNDIETLRQWVGRTEAVTETISAPWANRLAHTVGREATLANGDYLPPLWHFATHLTSVPLESLDVDGHSVRGAFLPPVALPRRMWAAGSLTFTGDLHLGESVTKTSTVTNVEAKTGRSGPLCFVTVAHELAVDGDIRISEVQDLVYLEHPDPRAPTPTPTPAPTASDFSREIIPSEVMLFRYSALTFNGHRIHYDRDYATTVEGYSGLVVHGPLTATLLADLAVRETGERLASFSFRGRAPLFDDAPFVIAGARSGADVNLWAQSRNGDLAMEATATIR